MKTRSEIRALLADAGPIDEEMEQLDVLTLSAAAAYELESAQLNTLKLRAARQDGIDSIETLRERMLEFVSAMSLSCTPVKMGNLNRRFARAAKQHGTSVPANVEFMVQRGLIDMIERGGVRALYAKRILDEQLSLAVSLGGVPTDEFLDNIILNTQ